MKVLFTAPDADRVCKNGYAAALAGIHRIARDFELHDDDRTLVVVLVDPCTTFDERLRTDNAVFVSPIHDIGPWGDLMKPPNPPVAAAMEEYLASFKKVIVQALLK